MCCLPCLPSGDYCQARLGLKEWPGNEKLCCPSPGRAGRLFALGVLKAGCQQFFLCLLFLLALFYCTFPVEELILTKASWEKWFVKRLFFFLPWKENGRSEWSPMEAGWAYGVWKESCCLCVREINVFETKYPIQNVFKVIVNVCLFILPWVVCLEVAMLISISSWAWHLIL